MSSSVKNSTRFKSDRRMAISVVLILVAVVVTILALRHQGSDPDNQEALKSADSENSDTQQAEQIPTRGPNTQGGARSRDRTNQAQTTSSLDALLAQLLSAEANGNEHEALISLKNRLQNLPIDQAVDLLLTYLENGSDQPFKLDFSVAKGGELGSWPTLRIFAIDLLGQIHPESAARFARANYQDSRNAEEGALHARNVSWAAIGRGTPIQDRNPDGVAEVAAMALHILRNQAWREHPSAGYQELFDAVPYTANQALIRHSTESLASQSPALSRPALVALNKLAFQRPDGLKPMLEELEAAGIQPEGIGQLLALGDPTVPEAFSLIEKWMFDPAVDPAAKKAFLDGYPTVFVMANHSLFDTINQSKPDLLARTNTAIEFLGEWKEEPDATAIKPEIEMAFDRAGKMQEN